MLEWLSENYQWIFSGVGIVSLATVFRLLQARRHKNQEPLTSAISDDGHGQRSSAIISDGSTINGPVAGRDVVINNTSLDIGTDELISILQLRASNIEELLCQHYHYAPVKKYLSKFSKLHLQHISALQKNNLVLAHEVLIAIYELSSALETDEFWKKHKAETPDLLYSLSADMFQRGLLICQYLIGERSSSPSFQPIEMSLRSPQKLNRISRLYQMILKTHNL